jgi:hypothetical protein
MTRSRRCAASPLALVGGVDASHHGEAAGHGGAVGRRRWPRQRRECGGDGVRWSDLGGDTRRGERGRKGESEWEVQGEWTRLVLILPGRRWRWMRRGVDRRPERARPAMDEATRRRREVRWADWAGPVHCALGPVQFSLFLLLFFCFPFFFYFFTVCK